MSKQRRLGPRPTELRETESRVFSPSCLFVAASSASRRVGHSCWSGTLLGVLLMALVASACGGGPGSGVGPMSLDEYAAACGAGSETLAGDLTVAGFLVALDEQLQRMESATPPEEVAELHDVYLDYQRALKKALEDLPESDRDAAVDMRAFEVLFSLLFEYGPAINDATAALPWRPGSNWSRLAVSATKASPRTATRASSMSNPARTRTSRLWRLCRNPTSRFRRRYVLRCPSTTTRRHVPNMTRANSSKMPRTETSPRRWSD